MAIQTKGLTSRASLKRSFIENVFRLACLAAVLFGFVALCVLTQQLVSDGWDSLSLPFLSSPPSNNFPERAGIFPALMGTLWLMSLILVMAVPLGIGTAIYLEEFAPRNAFTRLIQINISNLAGVPSIVYGLLGVAIFGFIAMSTQNRDLKKSVLAGAMTLSLMILPIVITAAQEAIRAVPTTHREGALALGSTRWEMVRNVVLPGAAPGVLTGVILGLSRAIGEAAPLITLGAVTFLTTAPSGPLDLYSVLPIQIFDWAQRPERIFQREKAAAAILVLMAVLVLFNSAAIYLRIVAKKRFR